ncbi:MAG: SRPBCC family protein [Myxococcota bacterium]|nr:SRPBCC family protein [Myxococcota bacterium]
MTPQRSHPVSSLLRLWFRFDVPVDRRAYALTGFSLTAVKYLSDAAIVFGTTGVVWTPADYLQPLFGLRNDPIAAHPNTIMALTAWALPFLWIGASMTVRRALDAGLRPRWGLLFFVPVVNYLWMLFLCTCKSATARLPHETAPRAPADLGSTVRAGALAAALGATFTVVSVFTFQSYGAALFMGAPFVIGFAAAHRLNFPVRHSATDTLAAAQIAVLLTAGALLAFALEGVICLAMAWPLAAVLAGLGAFLGREVAAHQPLGPGRALPLLLVFPLLMGAESATQQPPLREVVSVIEIDAAPEEVWPRVIGFSELPPPSRWVFELGIAYPVRARIEGSGAGAVRYCEFSTGPFVEPITRWEPPRRLSFDVVAQPAPMKETSPYRTVNAPHLIDGFVSERGEFRLVELEGGRTRLEGSTWYRIDMFPQVYWAPMADVLLHSIHARVLGHVKSLVEGG